MSRAVDRGAIVGHSDIMQEVFRLVEQVAPARSTVLITGESGTGKELIAKAIHEASMRAGKPFVTVNRVRTLRPHAWGFHRRGGGKERSV